MNDSAHIHAVVQLDDGAPPSFHDIDIPPDKVCDGFRLTVPLYSRGVFGRRKLTDITVRVWFNPPLPGSDA